MKHLRKKDDHYEIVAGERRFRASKLAGLEKVPVIITDMDDEASAVVAMLENLQREDLDYLEEAIGYSNLIKEYGFTQQQLAEKLGKSQSTIANKIRLLKLPEHIRNEAMEKGLSERHTRALLKLLKLDDDVAMLENLQREDLDYLEEAIGYSNLIKEYGFTQQQLAEKLGKSQSTIANKIRLLKLPEHIRNEAMEKGLSERHTRALLKLLKLDDEEIIIKAIDKISKNQMTVKKAEALIKDILANPKDEPKMEEEPPKRNMKAMINMRIYLNTIKQAYDMIKNTGVDAQYKEVEKDDYVDVIVRIPKRK